MYAMIDEEEGYTGDWTKDKEIMVELMDPMKRIHTMPLEEALGNLGWVMGSFMGLLKKWQQTENSWKRSSEQIGG
ncbi:hypothetical protein DACRYDRAFT_105833 [Dacryopinax primogenitus]|uniref:Uncharacterized protein n=1 Tax=Dacryopinax primogenitus (strain DJM 731) TaxID=1858805 RepID=M5GC53_DACPD|nr:uncharacterized protein DACRYDRAFT_105833 [Dacryopinax primogenitus]EJU03672.1 hypothetical protein DACRYDRAFT_105833 [Dacryopinax primogenitus]